MNELLAEIKSEGEAVTFLDELRQLMHCTEMTDFAKRGRFAEESGSGEPPGTNRAFSVDVFGE